MSSNLMGMTQLLPSVITSQLTGTGDDAVYTVPANSLLVIKSLVLVNITNDLTFGPGSAFNVLVSIAIVPSGSVVDGTSRIVSQYQLAPGDSLPLTEYVSGMTLSPGDGIYGRADVAAGATSSAQAVDVVVGALLGS